MPKRSPDWMPSPGPWTTTASPCSFAQSDEDCMVSSLDQTPAAGCRFLARRKLRRVHHDPPKNSGNGETRRADTELRTHRPHRSDTPSRRSKLAVHQLILILGANRGDSGDMARRAGLALKFSIWELPCPSCRKLSAAEINA